MPIRHAAALLAALALVLTPISRYAQPVDEADASLGKSEDASLDHLERLEKMLREAGVEPPPRPDDLSNPSDGEREPAEQAGGAEALVDIETNAPIIPPSFATVVFETETDAINERGSKASAAILHVRRWLERDDVKRRVAAEDVIKELTKWAELEIGRVESADDPVDAYILADDAINTLGQDPLATPFKDFLKRLQREHRGLSAIKAMAAYRRAMIDAHAVGLTGDWELIDFQNANVRQMIKEIKQKLALIVNSSPNSEAGQAARHTLQEWEDREAQAIADLPAWRYTVQLAFIQTGTKQESIVITQSDGTTYIAERTRPVYDPNLAELSGSFQNTSDKPYRYTFLAGVSVGDYPKVPFTKLRKNQLLGFELIQTPVLQPGEVYNWQATVSVRNIRHIHRKGVTMVEAFDPHDRR